MYEGKFVLENKNKNFAILGQGIAFNLGVNITNYGTPLRIYVPKTGKASSTNLMNAFSSKQITPIGIFQISAELDMKYVLVSKRFAQKLLNKRNKITGVVNRFIK